MNLFGKVINAWKHYRELKNMPLRLEFVVTDYCNLNCKGCTHYSPLAKKEFEELDVLEKQMAHLSRVCGTKLDSAYLIGGETLLYPRLVEAMGLLRKYFKTQNLYIFTNGIALPKMSDEFWKAAKDLDIIIALTRYPIKFDYDAVEQLCMAKGIKTEVFGDRSMADSFFKFGLDPEKKQNGKISHFKCYNRGCVSIIGDRLYPCSISACIGHLNNHLDNKFEHKPGDWLNVSEITDVKQIFSLRDKPVPFCSYCKNPPATVRYGSSKREVSEWIV